jgi:hypothetical protein
VLPPSAGKAPLCPQAARNMTVGAQGASMALAHSTCLFSVQAEAGCPTRMTIRLSDYQAFSTARAKAKKAFIMLTPQPSYDSPCFRLSGRR